MTNQQAFAKAFSLLSQGIQAKLFKENGEWFCKQVHSGEVK